MNLPHLFFKIFIYFFTIFQLTEALPVILTLDLHNQGQCYFYCTDWGTEAQRGKGPYKQGM